MMRGLGLSLILVFLGLSVMGCTARTAPPADMIGKWDVYYHPENTVHYYIPLNIIIDKNGRITNDDDISEITEGRVLSDGRLQFRWTLRATYYGVLTDEWNHLFSGQMVTNDQNQPQLRGTFDGTELNSPCVYSNGLSSPQRIATCPSLEITGKWSAKPFVP